MNEQQAVQHVLREKLLECQMKNPQFSLRSYAKKLDLNPGALSYILNGKRNVSRVMAQKIAQKLLLDPQQRSELLSLFPEKKAKSKMSPRYLEIDAANFKVAAEWEHFAIMSLLNCKGHKSSAGWIAERLGISETRATQVIERLLSLGLLSRSETGKLTRSKAKYRTTDDIASIAMKKHHDQTLEMAKVSLYRDSVEKRDFTTVTIAINPKNLSRAKELIRKFQDEFSDSNL